MEELFKQSFNYAIIRVFKNYSNVSNRSTKYNVTSIDEDLEEIDPFQESVKKYTVSAVKKPPHAFYAKLYKKGAIRTNFFYVTNPTESFENHALPGSPRVEYEPIDLINALCSEGNKFQDYFETTKDRHIKSHYNNPFVSIRIHKIERHIKRDGDKITIKFYVMTRTRNVNCIYFKKITNSTTITFNLHTGNFTIITFSSGKKKKVKHFYCNSFNALKTSLHRFYNIKESNVGKTSCLYKEYIDTFNTNQFQFALEKILGIKNISFSEKSEILTENFVKIWMERFVELKKIKMSDNGDRLLKWFYPTEKYLKKNDRKLVAAVLDRFGVKSNITIKILHQFPYTNIQELVELCRLFGKGFSKYIGNINSVFFTYSNNYISNDMQAKSMLLYRDRIIYNILDSEKEKIVHILNNLSTILNNLSTIGHSITMINDHFDMLNKVREYYPEMKLKAKTWESFNAEHAELSKINAHIKRAWSTHYVFDDRMVLAMEEPMKILFLEQIRIFNPIILKTTEDFFEEGTYMHHCVGSYVDHTNTMIISLRYGLERVTCEFRINTGKCIQMRYFYNQNPPEYFDKALKELENRFTRLYEARAPLAPKDKLKIKLVINGIEVKPESVLPELIEF
jgi:hypothetical protein